MEGWLLIGFVVIIVGLAVIGTPIYLSFLAGAAFYMAVNPALSFDTIPQMLLANVDKWSLIAIPLYVLAGLLLAYGGSAKYLVDFLDSLIGHLSGGMLVASVFACMIFAGMSGSGPADTVAIGAVMIGPMTALGYNKSTAMGCIATTATLANVIPPSIGFVLIGSWVQQDVAQLFMGGLLPGVYLGLCMAITAYVVARRQGHQPKPAATWETRGRAFVKAVPALLVPIIILGGIYGGIFTPTEAAAVACVWGFIASIIYREFSWGKVKNALLDSMRATSRLLLLIGTAMIFCMILTYNQIPQMFVEWVTRHNLSWSKFMLVCLALWGLMGCFLDGMAIFAVSIPILWPTAMGLGIDPIHYGVFMVAAIIAGQATPPFGMNLFAMAGLTRESVESVSRGAIPFIIVEYIAMILLIYIPALSTWLPSLMR